MRASKALAYGAVNDQGMIRIGIDLDREIRAKYCPNLFQHVNTLRDRNTMIVFTIEPIPRNLVHLQIRPWIKS